MAKNSSIRPTRAETKADITDRAAREIIDAETAERQSKTERLRAARLGQEAPHADRSKAYSRH
jgi:hypothetical protein